jgi:hypothetical protein
VYCSGTLTISPNLVLVLDAGNDTAAQWIFKAGSTLITGKHSSVVLKNGAQADNVFWAIGSSVTLGDACQMVGQMLIQASITAGHNVLIGGRVLALAAVTFQSGALVDSAYKPVTVNVTLGTCKKFAVMGGTTITFGSGKTILDSGSVGVSPGTSITGDYQLNSGTTESNTASAISCAYDLGSAYNTAATASCKNFLSNSELSGLTFTPGVYCSSSGSFTIAKLGLVTLDALNGTNAVWVFQMTTTLTTGDFSSIILRNKALSENVFWVVGSSASIGYDAFLIGNIIAYTSISYSSYALIDGRGLSFAGVSFSGYTSGGLPNGTSAVVIPKLRISLGACEDFAVQATDSVLFSNALSIIEVGSVGLTPGTSVSGNYRLNSGTTQINTAVVNQCSKDATTAFNVAFGATCTTRYTTADLSGKILAPGVYCSDPGTFSTSAFSTLILDAQNNTNAVWIFQTATTVITGTNSIILLKNGAQYFNVIWAVKTAATTGQSSFFVGQIFALTAVTIGSQSVLKGRAFAKTAMTFNGGGLVTQIASTTSVNVTVGRCSEFAVLGRTTVSFGTGESVIASGSVGVSPGTSITGNYKLKIGTTESNTAPAIACAFDLGTAYNTASTATCQYYLSNSELSGLTFTPGVYCSSSGFFTIAQQSIMTLDGLNVTNAVWIFQTSTKLTTGSSSSMSLRNGALSKNIYWAVGSTADIGYSAYIAGNLLTFSALKFAAYAIMDGRALSIADISFVGFTTGGTNNGTSGPVDNSVKVNLGGCMEFSVLAGTSLAFNLALTVVTFGSVGSFGGGAISGNYQLSDGETTQSVTAETEQCKNDLNDAYNAAKSANCDTTLSTVYLDGRVLLPGVYCSGTMELRSSTTLTLDAQNNTNSVWVFQVGTTLITRIASRVMLKNGAQASNVFWAVGTAATTGQSSFFTGNILAKTIVTIGARATLKGRAFATTSFSFDNGGLVSLDASYTRVNVTLDSCLKFAVLSKTSVTFGLGPTVFTTGSVGVSPGTSITGNYHLNSGTTDSNTASAVSCAYDMGTSYNTASTATCQYYLSNSELSGLTFTPGVYCSTSGSFTIKKLGLVTLDALNGTNAVWIFQIFTKLTTGDFSSMILNNGALSKNIYWSVAESVSVGYATFFAGTILAQGSITYKAHSILDGRGFSFAAVSFIGYSSAGLPNGKSVVVFPKVQVYLGGCLPFAVEAGSTANFNLALTVIHSGSVGVSPGMN